MGEEKNDTQLDRYKRMVSFIEAHFKEDIKINDIEEVSFYSYRNINRIFLALHHETIGQYIKRIRLEKAAEYLKYSSYSISDIAFDIGYADVAAFSKAFKLHFGVNPTAFRAAEDAKTLIFRSVAEDDIQGKSTKLAYEIEELPSFKILCLTHYGAYDHLEGIKQTWDKLLGYAMKKGLLDEHTIALGEVLDDDQIAETIHCRYNAAIVIDESDDFRPEGLFQTKWMEKQCYAKFVHKGSHSASFETYDKIYANWMLDVQLEFEDKPTLEFYLNDATGTPEHELLTEIYIPVKE